MLDNRYNLNPVLSNFPADFRSGATSARLWHGGFSSSRIWRIEIADQAFCLRRWPKERTDAAEIEGIHAVLRGVFESGFRLIPVPIPTKSGGTLVHNDGHLWELTAWLPGQPVGGRYGNNRCSENQLRAALEALAQFHLEVIANPQNRMPYAKPAGIMQRLERVTQLTSGGFAGLEATIANRRTVWPELAERSVNVVTHCRAAAESVAESLSQAARLAVPIQPCIRDIHREHILFDSDRVTGVIDFGAMRPDSRAGDVARLLGSLAGDDAEFWVTGLEAYTKTFPLTASERNLVRVYDASGVMLSAVHWLEWIFVDGRQFEDSAGVLRRFDEIAARLTVLANRRGAIIV